MENIKSARQKSRDELIAKVEAYYKEQGALDIHLFGSLSRDKADEFSDIDLWITLPKDKLSPLITNRFNDYDSFGRVLLIHEQPRNKPIGGSYSLILYSTDSGPQQMDIYLSDLPFLDLTNTDSNATVTSTAETDLDFLIAMTFIGIKMTIRHNQQFLTFLKDQYKLIKDRSYPQWPDLKDDRNLLLTILDNIENETNSKQNQAIKEIRDFIMLLKKSLYIQSL